MPLPLFYTAITALDREQHRTLRAPVGPGRLGFAAGSHLIACVVEEFGIGSLEMPILFAPSEDGATAVFLTGCEPGKSTMIRADGSWTGRYVPAYLRRFPFIRGDVDETQSVIGVDLSHLNAEEGEVLFTESGENSPFLNVTIDFVNQYAASGKLTEAFVKTLLDLKLLVSVTVDFKINDKSVSIHGLLAVDEERFANLSDEAFLDLRKKGYLPLIFAHRNSLLNIQSLANRS